MEEQPILARVREAVEQLPSGYPDALATLSETEIGKLRALYFAEAVKVIGGQLPSILVDKLPLNIVHVGLIHRIFPQAKLILALRHPCDVCLSCVMQQFALNDAMANFHTLEDAAQLYARAFGLWERYASLLPLNYHVVKYESLVEDVEGETRALLAFLGVESRADTENFWEHAQKRDAINTPSYHQVSQPIYRSARYRWTRYRRHLEPAMAHLGPYLKQFGYEGG